MKKRGEYRDLDQALHQSRYGLTRLWFWRRLGFCRAHPTAWALACEACSGRLDREMLPDNPSSSPTYDATPLLQIHLDPESSRLAGGTTTGTQPLVPASELRQFQLTAPSYRCTLARTRHIKSAMLVSVPPTGAWANWAWDALKCNPEGFVIPEGQRFRIRIIKIISAI